MGARQAKWIHDKLELLAAAGLPSEEVLAAATRLPAAWLGVAAEVGTIEIGKRADLLLLTANSLEDVKNTHAIAEGQRALAISHEARHAINRPGHP